MEIQPSASPALAFSTRLSHVPLARERYFSSSRSAGVVVGVDKEGMEECLIAAVGGGPRMGGAASEVWLFNPLVGLWLSRRETVFFFEVESGFVEPGTRLVLGGLTCSTGLAGW